MKRLSLFGLNIDISSANRTGKPLSLEDVDVINDATVRDIQKLTEREIQSRISTVTVGNLADTESVTSTLEKHGIVIIPDFLPAEAVQAAENAASNLNQIIDDFKVSGDEFFENPRYLIQKGAARLSGYKALSSYPKAVIQIREGQDEGMVDIFNIDYLFEEFRSTLRPAYENSGIGKILNADSPGLTAQNLNLYINANIKKTRGFHVDAYRKKLKSFIYLTDVLSLEDGPYTYVSGSHIDSSFTRINKTISRELPNKTETPVVPPDRIIPALARKGTLVISDQGGSHRGFPQGEGHRRMVSVMNYS